MRGFLAALDRLNGAIFRNHKSDSPSEANYGDHDAIRSRYKPLGITEQREIQSQSARESCILGLAVHADSDDLGISGFELRNISLICAKLTRSTTCERLDEEREHDVLLAQVVSELHLTSILILEIEIGRLITGLQTRLT